MNYFIVEDRKGTYSIVESVSNYYEFKKEYDWPDFMVVGMFGRKEYAEYWANYYATGGYKTNGAATI